MKYALLFLILAVAFTSYSQNDQAAFEHYKDSLNNNFKGDELSPLNNLQKRNFHTLNFYDFNPEMIVDARFKKLANDDMVTLKTTTQRKPVYQIYGYLYFELEGKEQRLAVLKNAGIAPGDKYAKYLSIMFTDETTGNGSYGVGRYMGLYAPLPEKVLLNFNHTYNPYCAYSTRYSCPIPPKENHINVAITAGVQPGFD